MGKGLFGVEILERASGEGVKLINSLVSDILFLVPATEEQE